ncbi:hypothetical protein BaRGS_00039571 [Batillaria attramentaria]|uniref:Uncharacterized protein n=1 Tax=Batillaria attramentaria TaxID=370345 RepID=A0ABD0J2P8_9CAEN
MVIAEGFEEQKPVVPFPQHQGNVSHVPSAGRAAGLEPQHSATGPGEELCSCHKHAASSDGPPGRKLRICLPWHVLQKLGVTSFSVKVTKGRVFDKRVTAGVRGTVAKRLAGPGFRWAQSGMGTKTSKLSPSEARWESLMCLDRSHIEDTSSPTGTMVPGRYSQGDRAGDPSAGGGWFPSSSATARPTRAASLSPYACQSSRTRLAFSHYLILKTHQRRQVESKFLLIGGRLCCMDSIGCRPFAGGLVRLV